MDYSYPRVAQWTGTSTLNLKSGSFAYAHLSQPSHDGASPRSSTSGSSAGSPRSPYSVEMSPSPSPSPFPQTPTSPYNWHSHSLAQQSSPLARKQDHLGSPLAHGYREYDLTSHHPTYSNASNFSSILCPQYITSPGLPVQSPQAPAFLPGRRGPQVPQRQYSTHFSAGRSPKIIQFRLQGSAEPGVPMRLLLDEFAPELPIEDPQGMVFDEDVASTITLRIWWPGYDLYPRRVTMRKATGLLNRIELAMVVTECFRNFVDEAKPLEDGKSSGNARWRVGKGGLGVKDLVLLSLYQVSKGSFQADVRLELDR